MLNTIQKRRFRKGLREKRLSILAEIDRLNLLYFQTKDRALRYRIKNQMKKLGEELNQVK